MKRKVLLGLCIWLGISTSSFAQLGIRAGVNMANQIHSFNQKDIKAAFKADNLTGYQLGLVYQWNPQESGFGFELGALLSQKGGMFKLDSTSVVNSLIKGYREMTHIDIPANLRFRLPLGGALGIYGTAGLYGSFALKGKTVFEGIHEATHKEMFHRFADRLDYGYSLGAGVELVKKLQIGASWSQALQKKDASKSLIELIKTETGGAVPNVEAAKNRTSVFAVTLTYLF